MKNVFNPVQSKTKQGLWLYTLGLAIFGAVNATGAPPLGSCPDILDRATQLQHLYKIYGDLAFTHLIDEGDVLSPMSRVVNHDSVTGRTVATFGSGWWDLVDVLASLPTASEYHLLDIVDYSIQGGAPAIIGKIHEVLIAVGAENIAIIDSGFMKIIGDQVKPSGWFEENLPLLSELRRPYVLSFETRDPWGKRRTQKLYFHVVNFRNETQMRQLFNLINSHLEIGAILWNSGTMISSVPSVSKMMIAELRKSKGILILHPEVGTKIVAKEDWFETKPTLKPKSILIDQDSEDARFRYGRRLYSVGLNQWLREAEAGTHTVRVGDEFIRDVSRRIVPVVISFK